VQSTLGVAEIQPVAPAFLRRTLDHLCADLPPSGIKIGMLGSAEIAATVAAFLTELRQTAGNQRPGNPRSGNVSTPPAVSPIVPSAVLPIVPPIVASIVPPIVLDPILRASSGADLLPPAAIDVLHQQLLPVVTWITPNWHELSVLTALPIENLAEAEAATHALAARHPHLHIVATAGDHAQPTDILRLPSGEIHRFAGDRLDSTSTHGTGCAFSSALLSLLVLRDTPLEAVRGAKHFVTEAIRHAPTLGHGRGPLNLFWHLS
jgi:hydroxymethylpyrimidine/phosphomethylpyrimidine kinase